MKKIYLAAITLICIISFFTAVASAAILHMDVQGYPTGTDYIEIDVCTNFILDFYLTGVPALGIASFTHDLLLDPLVEIEAVTVKIGDPATAFLEIFERLEGEALFFGGLSFVPSFPEGPDDRVDLASIEFHCIALGYTELIQAWHSSDPDNFLLGDFMTTLDPELGYPGIVGFQPLVLGINQVPIPGTMLLFASSLLLGVGIKRKKILS